MSVQDFQIHSHEDDHTIYLSQLYTLYSRDISWHTQLCDIGYIGYPDPKYEINGSVYKPDLLAFNEDGDIQHIEVLDLNGLDSTSPENDIESRIQDVERFHEISDTSVEEYLEPREHEDFSPVTHEAVVLLPGGKFNQYDDMILEVVDENDLILWVIRPNGTSTITKEHGQHSNITLDNRMSSSIDAYPKGDDLLQFTRETENYLIKYEFTQRLLSYCSRNRQREFIFSEIDLIMTEKRPPMLWQLTEEERADIWRECLYAMLHRFNLIEQVGGSAYQWKKQKILKETRYQNRMIEDVVEQLDPSE